MTVSEAWVLTRDTSAARHLKYDSSNARYLSQLVMKYINSKIS